MNINKIIIIALLLVIIIFLKGVEKFTTPQPGEIGAAGARGRNSTSTLTRSRIELINHFLNNLTIRNGIFMINNQPIGIYDELARPAPPRHDFLNDDNMGVIEEFFLNLEYLPDGYYYMGNKLGIEGTILRRPSGTQPAQVSAA